MKTQDPYFEEDAFSALDVPFYHVDMQFNRAANILQKHIQRTKRRRIESFFARKR